MKTPFALCLATATGAVALLESTSPAQNAPAAKPAAARILLVTGIDYPGHPWQQTAPALKELLEKDPRLTVRVVEDPHFLDSAAITNSAAIILHFMNWEVPGPGPAARENLKRYVQNGGGVMLTHFACGAWYGEWPEFKNLAGRAWFGQDGGRQHDPRGKFTVDIADKEHPITNGLEAFETDDELYTCLTGDAPIHIVATAKSKADSKDYPMAFVLSYGQGRVFHTVLGHDVRAYTITPGVGELMRRGCAWAAGLSPQPAK